MSMNLVFYSKSAKRNIDFPFQTPTVLSYSVMDANSVSAKMALIEEYVKTIGDEEWRKEILTEVKSMLKNKDIELRIF